MELTIETTKRHAERFRTPETYGHFIGGEWVGAESGETIPLINPATLETVAYIQSGNAVDAKRAVDAAHAAFPKWSRMYPNERQAIIAAIAARLRARVFDYAMMEVVNNGKPITISRSAPVISSTATKPAPPGSRSRSRRCACASSPKPPSR